MNDRISVPARILFVGNSFVSRNDLPQLVVRLAESAGVAFETSAIVAGGASLRRHINSGAVSRALASSQWDFVVLQEQSTLPIKNATRYHQNVRDLDSEIRTHGAATVLYMTWARRSVPHTQQRLTDAVRSIGDEIGARIAPAGVAWQAVTKAHPEIELYAKDGSHPSLAGSFLAACAIFAAVLDDPAIRLAVPVSVAIDQASAQRLLQAARQAAGAPGVE